MDDRWIGIQKRTFTNWVNQHLKDRILKIEDLYTDLEDGLMLINLLEIISDKKIPSYNKKPKIRAQKLENNSYCLNFLKKEGIKLVAIGPEDIVDHQGKLILGLIWTIILRYQIQKGDGAGSAKNELLEWVRKQIPECNVSNFTSSWQDGKAICHLVDSLERGAIKPDLKSVDNNPNALANATLGEDTAERALGIPKILQPEDMVSDSPDELSVMTYISYFRDYLENLAKRRSQAEKERIAVPENTIAHGTGLQEGEQYVPAEFTIQARNCFGTNCPCGGETFDVQIKSPLSKTPVPVTVKDNNDGTYTCNYTPVDPGRHTVAINLKGKGISGSPYTVPIAKTTASVYGDGTEKGEQFIPANVTIACQKMFEKGVAPTPEELEVTVQGPLNVIKPKVTDNKDGTYSTSYTPTEFGRHVLNVNLRGKPLATFNVPIDKTKVLASGPGLEKGEQFIPAKFNIEAVNYANSGFCNGPTDFAVNISGPAPVSPMVSDNGNGIFEVTYTPTAPGRYNISINLKGQPISNGPFAPVVAKTGCSASGPGLDSGEQFVPSNFVVNAKPLFDAGIPLKPSDIEVAVQSPSGTLPPFVTDNNDGTFNVSFTPRDVGRHAINVAVKGQPVASVNVPVNKTTCSAYGPGLEKATQFIPADFTVDCKVLADAGVPANRGDIDVKIVGPQGPVEATIKENPNGTFDVQYVPNDVGRHTIDVAVKGTKIANKSVPVGKTGISASGPGLDRAEQYIPSEFDINAQDLKNQGVGANPNDFDIKLQGPSGAEVPVDVKDNGDGTFTCKYTPVDHGRHKLDLALKGKPILNNYSIPVDKSTTSPEKSTASGPGIEPGNVINKPTHFTIQARNKIGDPMKTGGDPFKVVVSGPYRSDPEPKITDKNDGTYLVEYEPTVPGPHKVEVSLNSVPISGSPWEFDVLRSDDDPDPSQFDVFGPGLEGGDTANPCIFTIVSKNSKGQQLPHGGAPIEVEVNDASGNGVPAKVVDNGDGTYTAQYDPVDPGDHKVDVILRSKIPLYYFHVRDSPYYVPIKPGTDASNSLVYGPGLTEAYDTKPAVFNIKARDRFGNDMGRGGDPFEVQVAGPSGDVPVSVVDNDDGTYTVTYEPNTHGPHTIYCTLKHNPVAKSPYKLSVLEGAAHEFTFLEKFQFTIRTKTKSNNFKTVGGETFEVQIDGAAGPVAAEFIEIQDLKNGIYTVNYSLPAPGDYHVNVRLNGQHVQGSPFLQNRPAANYS